MENPKTKTNLSDQFSTFIKEKRTALGISQYELSERIFGTHRQRYRISNFEAGKGSINLDTLSKIMEELNCTIIFKEN